MWEIILRLGSPDFVKGIIHRQSNREDVLTPGRERGGNVEGMRGERLQGSF